MTGQPVPARIEPSAARLRPRCWASGSQRYPVPIRN